MSILIEEEIRGLLETISTQKRKNYTEKLREIGIHTGQDQLLCLLAQAEGKTQRELCQQLNCEASTLTNMLKSLENHALIHRLQDEKDARTKRVYLTGEGLDIIEPIQLLWQEEQKKLLEGFTQEELETLHQFLEKMAYNMTKK